MKPELLILKRRTTDGRRAKLEFHFSVVDSDSDKAYPANFICVLPAIGKYQLQQGKHETVFAKIFGSKQTEVAKMLLLDALGREKNLIVRRLIAERLSCLEKIIGLTPLLEILVADKMITPHTINVNEANELVLTGNCDSCNIDPVKNYLTEKGYRLERSQNRQYCIVRREGIYGY